jgi:uncharacterized protein with von Willebrand factor type A (vWA) domain
LTVLNTFGHDYKLILVGDATMSPYESPIRAAVSSISTRKRAMSGWIGCADLATPFG